MNNIFLRERGPVSAAAATIPLAESSDSLSRLFAEHHRRVLIAAYRITGSMADAEDVTQTVFLRLGNGEGFPVTNAGSYLYRAAINGALDLLRKRKSARFGRALYAQPDGHAPIFGNRLPSRWKHCPSIVSDPGMLRQSSFGLPRRPGHGDGDGRQS